MDKWRPLLNWGKIQRATKSTSEIPDLKKIIEFQEMRVWELPVIEQDNDKPQQDIDIQL